MTLPTRRTLNWIAAAAVLLMAAHLADWWVYRHVVVPGVNDRDWGRLLRTMGYAPTWGLLALAIWLEGRGREDAPAVAQRRAAGAVVLAMIVGGLGAELLKLLVRRERPDATGLYHFRAYSDRPFYSGGFGMPSSHAAVAFGGAGALHRRFPRAAPVLYALAFGCGMTRILAQAHFLSDVVAGALIGTAAGQWSFIRLTRGAARRLDPSAG